MALTKTELLAEQKRLLEIGELCERYGEADGRTAARSQCRAIDRELARLDAAGGGKAE